MTHCRKVRLASATHGGQRTAHPTMPMHPHVSGDGRVAVIHNGIIENFAVLREELEASGVTLLSETDSEVAAHLVSAELAADPADLVAAVRRVCQRLTGAFTLVIVHADFP